MEVIESTEMIERYFGFRLASLIPFHYYDPFYTSWLWFCFILTISMILSILSYKLINSLKRSFWAQYLEEPLNVIAHWNQEEQDYMIG
jgi:hypothetical protein